MINILSYLWNANQNYINSNDMEIKELLYTIIGD